MTIILKGAPVANQVKEELTAKISTYIKQGIQPKVAILRVGDKPEDKAYETRVVKNCEKIGMAIERVTVDHNIIMSEFVDKIDTLNKNPGIHGILIFSPLPSHLDAEIVSKTISPQKDIDCMSPENCEKIFKGTTTGLSPCTPLAVLAVLKHYDYDINGLNVVIVNRSMVLGKPLSMMLLAHNATVTLCHSKTKDLASLTRRADVVVTGVGRPKYFGRDYFTRKSFIIDVGINYAGDQMCGDVDYEAVAGHCAAITPVPGGIGIVTSMMLLKNVIQALEIQQTHLYQKYEEVSHGKKAIISC